MEQASQKTPDRQLNDREAAIVRWMLETCSDHPQLANTVPSLRVREVCACGCASVNFTTGNLGGILGDAMGKTDDGRQFGLILWGKTGDEAAAVTGLEIYELDEGTTQELPDSLDRLEAIPPPSQCR